MNKDKTQRALHIAGTVTGIAMIVLLLPMLIINMTLIVKGVTQPEQVPTVFGVAPLTVQSGSMFPAIQVDDLILVKQVDTQTLREGDIIAFQLEGSNNVVTHRIIALLNEDGVLQFVTQGDANNVEDENPVDESQVVGLYFARFAGLGRFAMLIQKPIGMVLFVAVPLMLFFAYDMLRRFLDGKKKKLADSATNEELERLRALAASLEQDKEAEEQN